MIEATRSIGARRSEPTLKKLDPALQILLEEIAEATPQQAGCFPETVDILFEFRGDRADLERAGLQIFSANRHPEGTFIGTGRIKTTQLPALAAVDHLIAVDGGGRYRPE